ncbi:MAG: tellurite resistance TerB family protein [Mesorhizobium sp.]|nr:tellurite resistance TerB family protein [Mesorhizobium sp.]
MTLSSPQEALIHLMVIVSASDRDMGDAELARIGAVVRTLPVFAEFEHARTLEVAQHCQKLLSDDEVGLEGILTLIHDALTPELRETAYALAVDVAIADRSLNPEEHRMLDIVKEKFELERPVVNAIERAASIRHRKA